jgi:hypothetical protein
MAKLPTYDDACEQLGGRPWLEKPEATDRWFLADAQSLMGAAPLSAPGFAEARAATPSGGVAVLSEITAAFDLKKRMSLSTKLAIVAIVAIAAFAVIAAVAANL